MVSGCGVTAAYVDLATYDNLEKYLYGGCYAVTPFVREITKATWFSTIPTKLSLQGSTPAFGGEINALISRAGDYLLNNWVRVTLPEVNYSTLYNAASAAFETQLDAARAAWAPQSVCAGRIQQPCPAISMRWTRNLMHNLVECVSITFNDLCETQFTSCYLDFWTAFTVPASKRQGYDNMIGNAPELSDPLSLDALQLGPSGTLQGIFTCTGALGGATSGGNPTHELHLDPNFISESVGGLNSIGCATLMNSVGPITGVICPPGKGRYLPARTLNLPLPLPHSRDSGVALPTAALPYNDMKINIKFRNASELLVFDVYDSSCPSNVPAFPGFSFAPPSGSTDGLSLGKAEVWGSYAVVSNAERSRMGCHPRDILIEQQQEAPKQKISGSTNGGVVTQDVRFSHSIKALFWALKNCTIASDHSNYTASTGVPLPDGHLFAPYYGADPIESTSLMYENSTRLDGSDLTSDYYSLVTPYFNAPVIAQETGYHLYSYALDFYCMDPLGSTNFGKLSHVSLSFTLSDSARHVLDLSTTTTVYNEAGTSSTTLSTTSTAGALRTQANGNYVPCEWLWGNQRVQSFEVKVVGVNWQIARISGGVFAFPVL